MRSMSISKRFYFKKLYGVGALKSSTHTLKESKTESTATEPYTHGVSSNARTLDHNTNEARPCPTAQDCQRPALQDRAGPPNLDRILKSSASIPETQTSSTQNQTPSNPTSRPYRHQHKHTTSRPLTYSLPPPSHPPSPSHFPSP